MRDALAIWIVPGLTGGAAGLVLGLLYFEHLRRATASLAGCKGAARGLAFGSALRIAVAVAAIIPLAKWSPVAALAALLGFSLARRRALSKAMRS